MQFLCDLLFGIGVIALTWFYVSVLIHRHHCLLPHRWMFGTAIVVWSIVILFKFNYLDYVVPPQDAIYHLNQADEIAARISFGDWSLAKQHFSPGNAGFQLILGLAMSLASPSSYFLRIAFAAIAFCGILSVLETMIIATGATRMPLLPVAATLLLPSVIFWTPEVLKEAGTLWGCCSMQTLAFPISPARKKTTIWKPLTGMIVVGFLRPQWLVMWMVAFAVASLSANRKWFLGLLLISLLYPAGLLLKICAPGLMEKAEMDGVLSARQSFLETAILSVESAGGNTLTYYLGGPVPIVTGGAIIFLRPFPFEIHNLNELISGLEVWILSLIMFDNFRRQPKISVFLHQPGIGFCCLILLLYSWDFSYLYSMGLAVRQRVAVLPVMLILAFLPQIIRANAGSVLTQGRKDPPLRRPGRVIANSTLKQRVSRAHQSGRPSTPLDV